MDQKPSNGKPGRMTSTFCKRITALIFLVEPSAYSRKKRSENTVNIAPSGWFLMRGKVKFLKSYWLNRIL